MALYLTLLLYGDVPVYDGADDRPAGRRYSERHLVSGWWCPAQLGSRHGEQLGTAQIKSGLTLYPKLNPYQCCLNKINFTGGNYNIHFQ